MPVPALLPSRQGPPVAAPSPSPGLPGPAGLAAAASPPSAPLSFPGPSVASWALVDCNNFYASCERLFRPDLRGKPIVVLSNNDGCIISRSDEAKALGVEMGAPAFKVRRELARLGVHVFSSNYALYGDLSSRVMRTLSTLAPEVEVYSIDEAFLPLRGPLAADPVAVGRALRERVTRWTGIPISVGIAPTRTLAKITGRVTKRTPHCQGVFDLARSREVLGMSVDDLLGSLPVDAVWGVGRRLAGMLRGAGITTARALRDAGDDWVRRRMSVTGLRTVLELRGIPCIGAEEQGESPSPRHTVVSSRSFAGRITDVAMLREALATHAALAGAKLRRAGLVAGGLAVHVRTARHDEEAALRCDDSVALPLPVPTADSAVFIRLAHEGLDRVFRPGYPYAKAGVMLYGLERADTRQGSLLALAEGTAEHDAARERLMAVADRINARYGRGKLRHAAEGLDDEAPWHMRQRHRSPRRTTAWDELAEALCR